MQDTEIDNNILRDFDAVTRLRLVGDLFVESLRVRSRK